jgi:sec-independent protein translocase protein TatC
MSTNPLNNIIPYLLEIRKRLLICLTFITLIFFFLLPFANTLYHALAMPLLHNLPTHATLIATAITSPFWTPLKVVMVTSILVAIPFVLYQCWAFVAPALYKHERRWVCSLVFASSFLFYAGMIVGYFAVFPLIFHFLAITSPQGVTIMPDMSLYLDFALQLLLAFGFAFEVPIAVVLLDKTGILSAKQLEKQRPYVVIAAFVIGMIIAPDVVSQIALALPLWLLFEVGILVARILRIGAARKKQLSVKT